MGNSAEGGKAPVDQGALDSNYGPEKTISFRDVELQSEAITWDTLQRNAATLETLLREEALRDAMLRDAAAWNTLQREAATRDTLQREVATRDTLTAEISTAAKESRRPSMAGVSTGAKYTFGVAKWTVSTILTWIYRAIFWIVPTTIGFLLSAIAAGMILMAIQPSGFFWYLLAFILLMVAGMISGAILALGQALALKTVDKNLGGYLWWIMTTGGSMFALPIGGCIGWHVSQQFDDHYGIGAGILVGLLIYGAVIGALQAYLLKYYFVTLWWLWVVPSAIGAVLFTATMSFTMASQTVDLVAAALRGGLVYGVFTGVSLALLIRKAVTLNRMLRKEI